MKEFIKNQMQLLSYMATVITLIVTIVGVWVDLRNTIIDESVKQTTKIIGFIDDILRDEQVMVETEILTLKSSNKVVPERLLMYKMNLKNHREKIPTWTKQ